ncbi:MAG: hypothetical protein GIX03_16260 [Candidatus Eremiobacteraeota bacterium]|nr:hypothetical protein [Candidatus Eremiobacteraeota bacterium]MBC5804517.1 hypothetical protein [Candidatus Eremiobacteraeota bacterium]
MARGIAGSHACGTAIVSPNGPAGFGEMRVHRLVIWGSGAVGELPPAAGGWAWESKSVAADDPTAPLDDLQRRMRNAEGVSAASLCGSDRIVVADGPLDFALRRDRDIVGFVKTHRRALLEPALHARIPRLRPRERTSLFRIGDERFSCYLRLAGCGFKCEESNRTLPGRPSWGSSLPLISRFSFPIEKAPASIRIIVHAE